MIKIYKYVLFECDDVKDIVTVKIPFKAKIVSIQKQGNAICAWALVDTKGVHFVDRTFHVFGTGHEVTCYPLSHVASVQDGPFVWHLFEPGAPS